MMSFILEIFIDYYSSHEENSKFAIVPMYSLKYLANDILITKTTVFFDRSLWVVRVQIFREKKLRTSLTVTETIIMKKIKENGH